MNLTKLTKFILLILIVFGSISGVWGQSNPLFDCQDWGEDLAMGFFCKIHADKVEEFLNSLPEGQREILETPYPVELFCVTKSPTRNDIKRYVLIHEFPHEESPILFEIPHDIRMKRLEFVGRQEGSLYNWVKINYQEKEGFVVKHSVWCNRGDLINP